MPVLNWIGKSAVVKHHQDVPYRLLERVPELSCLPHGADARRTSEGRENLIVQGDNLHALKALLPRYAGQVKCIYIDPPYNTGVDDRDETGSRSGWIYSDNVSSPEISAWLGKVVGAEAEDLSRHDKWLCMIYPRLVLLRQFLRDDGVIFVSIDENEYGSLRLVLDEIFGVPNRVGTIIWKNVTDNNPTNIAVEHEYILCYSRRRQSLPKEWKSANLTVKTRLLEVGDQFVRDYLDPEIRQAAYTTWFRAHRGELWPFQDYKLIDKGGIYTGMRSVHNPGKEGYRYDVLHPVTGKACVEPMMGYRFPPETMQRLLEQQRILFGDDERKLIELKVYARDYRAKLSSLFELDGRSGTNEIKDLFPGNNRPFDFPKPTGLIEELLSFTTSGNDVVLDSFAGSGTTGHAILKLNAADGGNRKFILAEMKASIAEKITAERLRSATLGFRRGVGESTAGLGGGFEYFRLSAEPLFAADGQVREDVRFSQLAEFVWFSETGTAYRGGGRSPLLGVHQGRAIYLLYNGMIGDKSVDGGNILTGPVLDALPKHAGPRVIYAAASRLGAPRLQREGISFKQTPYALDVPA